MAFAVGDKVRCSAYKDWYGTSLASFVRTTVYDIIQIGGGSLPQERVVIGFKNPYAVTAAVDVKYLESINPKPVTTVTEYVEPAPVETELDYDPNGEIDPEGEINNSSSSSSNKVVIESLEGQTVQNIQGRKDSELNYDEEYIINITEETDKYSGYYPYQEYDVFENFIAAQDDEFREALNERIEETFITKVETNHKDIIQNKANFPKQIGWDSSLNAWTYDYSMNYDTDSLGNGTRVNDDIEILWSSINIDIRSRKDLRTKNFDYYNRHKVQNPNDALAKSFAHVFFVRPDCNLFSYAGSSISAIDPVLLKNVGIMSEYYYSLKHSPELLRQLVQDDAGYSHEFSMFLSNHARSFELSDEYITTDEYSAALTGHKIPFGRHNIESKTSGKFTISYKDNRDLYIYNLHKLWTDYISYVYRGNFYPKTEYILNKILDYTTCTYYIVCAEDGETVIFWAKYWGVFPLNAPSSKLSFNLDSKETMNNPELTIDYMYAYKEDFNPLSLVEFNSHSSETFEYVATYQKNKLGVGYTWSGAPFIETTYDPSNGKPYTFKLRFRPETGTTRNKSILRKARTDYQGS